MRAPAMLTLNSHLQTRGTNRTEESMRTAALSAARAEILLTEEAGFLEPENAMERTYKFTQRDVREAVDEETQANMAYRLSHLRS